MKPTTEDTLMMRPLRWAPMYGRTALIIRIAPNTLMLKAFWSWVMELSSAAPVDPTPALLTSTSMRPNR
jgi:hypothetical protein